jgi:hypothetical protein
MKPIKTNKLPEIILHSPINQLIRMDQGLNVKGSQGTCARESIIILLAHLGTFLKSEKAMQESWNIVHPIFESFSFFESQIAKEIYRDYNTKTSINDLIKAGKLEEAQIKSNSIAEAILSKVDQDWDDAADRAEITEQILSLGWPKHAVGVGLRRIDSDAYEIIIANGGRGVRFNGIYDESTFQTTKVVRGNREALKPILTKMIYSSAREKKQKNDDTNFYKDLGTLLSVVDFNFSPGRLQPTGNCAIHNIKELIYYIIQRKEAAIQKGNLTQSHPYSTANRLSRHYHQRGKEQME